MTSRSLDHLPDPFLRADGTRVRTTAEWPGHRLELRERIVDIEYGGLPATPARTWWDERHAAVVRRRGSARLISGRVIAATGRPFGFMLQLLDQLGVHYRPGGHDQRKADGIALLDFMDWRLRGKGPTRRFDVDPYPRLAPAYSWEAPSQ